MLICHAHRRACPVGPSPRDSRGPYPPWPSPRPHPRSPRRAPARFPTFISACKYPGGSCSSRPKGYSLFFRIDNPTDKTIYIYTVTITSVTGTPLTFAFSVPRLPVAVPAGGSVIADFVASSGNSAQQAFSADVTVTWGHNPTPPDPDNHPPVTTRGVATETPPNCPACPD